MDIRAYFEKLHKTEQMLNGDEVVIVSEATPDGGKAGMISEVRRETAAKMIVEHRARLASEDEVADFRQATERAIALAEQARIAQKVQVAVVSEHDLRNLRAGKPTKS
ncbi:MAG TPA: hypothetical protein VES20_23615 [Bryobacteraceae bacterium]|nr:hypothetical protein [Bryobacteraceae bacterium]